MDFVPYMTVSEALAFREDIGGEKTIGAYCHFLALHAGRRMAEIWGTRVMDEDGSLTAHMVRPASRESNAESEMTGERPNAAAAAQERDEGGHRRSLRRVQISHARRASLRRADVRARQEVVAPRERSSFQRGKLILVFPLPSDALDTALFRCPTMNMRRSTSKPCVASSSLKMRRSTARSEY